jgi:hypothetical protein
VPSIRASSAAASSGKTMPARLPRSIALRKAARACPCSPRLLLRPGAGQDELLPCFSVCANEPRRTPRPSQRAVRTIAKSKVTRETARARSRAGLVTKPTGVVLISEQHWQTNGGFVKHATIALSIAVIVAGITAVGAAGKTTARSLTWHLVEKDAGFNFIDNPPRQGSNEPPLIGDQFSFRSEMLSRSGKHAGWLNATCMVTTGGTRGLAPCYGVMSFQGGQLMLMAQVSFASDTTHAVFVGGTGVYRGATGTVVSVDPGGRPASATTLSTWCCPSRDPLGEREPSRELLCADCNRRKSDSLRRSRPP